MTEEQAGTKPCIGPENCGKRANEYQPFFATGMSVVEMYQRDQAFFEQWKARTSRLCIGSACMAARWAPDLAPIDGVILPQFYCGLAGKP